MRRIWWDHGWVRTFLGLDRAARRRRRLRHDPSASSLRRIKVALAGLVAVLAVGTVGYVLQGFTLLEAVYQTVTTVATVGFREVRPLTDAGEVFTILLIIIGAGTVLYNLGVLVEAFTEGHLRAHLERRRMDTTIDRMRDHVIICGFGRVGRAAAERLGAMGVDLVVVDRDPRRLEGSDLSHLVGDATGDEVLRRAGIQRARALIATLDSDAETVYLTLSARALAPDLVIVARARTTDSKVKLELAGADRAVSPQLMGGRRLAAFAMQPHLTEFIDVAMHEDGLDLQLAELEIGADSPLSGVTIADLAMESSALHAGAAVLAVRTHPAGEFVANPTAQVTLNHGNVLIIFGNDEQVTRMIQMNQPRH